MTNAQFALSLAGVFALWAAGSAIAGTQQFGAVGFPSTGITLTEGSAPSTPASGDWGLHATAQGLDVLDDGGRAWNIGRASHRGFSPLQWGAALPGPGNSTGLNEFGLLDGLTFDDATSSYAVTLANGGYLQQNCSAVADDDAYWYGQAAYRPNQRLYFSHSGLHGGTATDQRFFVGLADSATNLYTGDASIDHVIGIGYSTATDGSNYVIVHNDNSGTNVRTDSGVAADDALAYKRFAVWTDDGGTTWDWAIYTDTTAARGTLEGSGTVSSDLPATATSLIPMFGIRTLTTTSRSCYTRAAYIGTGISTE